MFQVIRNTSRQGETQRQIIHVGIPLFRSAVFATQERGKAKCVKEKINRSPALAKKRWKQDFLLERLNADIARRAPTVYVRYIYVTLHLYVETTYSRILTIRISNTSRSRSFEFASTCLSRSAPAQTPQRFLLPSTVPRYRLLSLPPFSFGFPSLPFPSLPFPTLPSPQPPFHLLPPFHFTFLLPFPLSLGYSLPYPSAIRPALRPYLPVCSAPYRSCLSIRLFSSIRRYFD